MSIKTVKEMVKHFFTDVEISAFARDSARASRVRQSLEQRKKEVVKQITAEIEEQSGIVDRMSAFINEGYDYRDVECRVEFDTPVKDTKRLVRIDTGETVKEIPMSHADKQIGLPLVEEGAPKEPGEDATAVVAAAAAASAGPTLAPAVLAGGTHQKGRRGRPARNKEAEAEADGSAPDPAEEPEEIIN